MNITLSGLRVVVTAGGSGIGRAIVEAFVAAKARVAICDTSSEHLTALCKAHPDISAVPADVSDPLALESLFRKVEEEFGGLDVLVNNAGVTGPFAGIDEIGIEDWDRTVSVNLNGAFYCTRRAVPMIKRAGGGAIINISSVAGRLGYAFRTPYAATKWAIIGLTQSLAMEVGPDNIRVNAILPGFVAGPRHENNAHKRARLLGISVEEQKRRVLSKISTRRLTQPNDIANVVVFLASEAGAHISGQSLGVCGNVETLGG